MKLRKRERVLVTIFVAALAALAVDRLLVFGVGPQSALAGENTDANLPAPTKILPPRPADSQPAPPAEVADVFAWARLGTPNPQAPIIAETPNAPTPGASAFAAAHQLDAIVLGPRPMALIDGVALQVGDVLDGFTLQEVRLREALFVSDAERAVLRLPVAGGQR